MLPGTVEPTITTATVILVPEQVQLDSDEIPIIEYRNSEALRKDPRNRTVALLDVLRPPGSDIAILVMPKLLGFYVLPFRHVSEMFEALGQFLQVSLSLLYVWLEDVHSPPPQGLVFMHEHRVSHGDACILNDGRWASTYDVENALLSTTCGLFLHQFWTLLPHPDEGVDPRMIGGGSQDRTVPELLDGIPYDPYKLDVYQFGGVIGTMCQDLDMLRPLVSRMKTRDFTQRPTATEAYQMFEDIRSSLSQDDWNRRIWHVRTTPEDRHRIEFLSENPMDYKTMKLSGY
ncbi:unnamed protein product [Cyclocybe aegerita]|uniref:Uncharacterized protein n=1 Tax=Cyclocybe aegerita TaxID=1973307 RepID=A0A8S0WSQ0_CYCAE|nr:unnamed protein product [Cyclocybe aegerita]